MALTVTRYEIAGEIATITLNRPHRMNAWIGSAHTEKRWALAEAERDPPSEQL